MPRKTTPGLPFLITAQRVGTQHACKDFIQFYGPREGRRIFLETAELHGQGTTTRQKANSIFKKGAKRG